MTASDLVRLTRKTTLLGVALLSGIGLTGCQSDIGGQTLPSSNYLKDDVQYFPPGPQFPLAKEAAAQKTIAQEQAQQQ